MVLRNYYEFIVVSKNMTDAIYFVATLRMQRDGPDSRFDYDQLTLNEHTCLTKLAKNIKLASDFLFKGIKHETAVGNRARATTKTIMLSDEKTRNLDGVDHLASVESNEEVKEDMALTMKSQKSTSLKTKTTSKSRMSTTSPGKKGRKKKGKGDDNYIDWTIPEGKTKPLNLFLPDRVTMQKLVLKAAGLKEGVDEPPCEEVRPWVKIQNMDVLV